MEPAAVAFALLGVVFTIFEKRICWIANILACLLYIKIFKDAFLPGQALLQILFIAAGFYGYISWGKEGELKVKKLGLLPLTLLLLASALLGYLIQLQWSDILWSDCAITIGSIVATYLAARKYLESWIAWIAIDCAAVGLFLSRDLKLTALLYITYMVLAVIGLKQWSKPAKLLTSHSLEQKFGAS